MAKNFPSLDFAKNWKIFLASTGIHKELTSTGISKISPKINDHTITAFDNIQHPRSNQHPHDNQHSPRNRHPRDNKDSPATSTHSTDASLRWLSLRLGAVDLGLSALWLSGYHRTEVSFYTET